MDHGKATTPSRAAQLELANRLFREFHAACFWHLKPDLVVTEALLPLVVKGLRAHGGRLGALAAARLLGDDSFPGR
jgi:hypothetical protein